MRLRDWRIRTKLATVLIIPSVAFLVLATFQTGSLIGRANVLGSFAEQVRIGQEITTLVDALQQERDRTAGELAGLRASGSRRTQPEAAMAALRPLYTETELASSRLQSAAEPLSDSEASWRVSYSRVEEALKTLPDVRSAVPAAVLSTDTVLGNYNRAIDALLSLLAEPSPGNDEPDLTQVVLRYVQFARHKEILSQIRGQLYAAARAGRYGPEEQVKLTDLRAQELTTLANVRVTAAYPQVLRYGEIAVEQGFDDATTMERNSIVTGGGAPQVLDPDDWWAASQKRHELLRGFENEVLGDAVDRADGSSDAQLSRTLLVAGGVLAVLLLALLASIIIGRSIARSLRMLRGQALRVAQVELPEALERLRTVNSGISEIEVPPADVRSMDEIGDVAEAFVAVHRSAVTVAVEQAVMRRNVNGMFVNLARRSQVLVERQLELLDELEREESDPDQLDNLFKLDHLAARMRRNDDSLLVLAGIESSRRWSRPVLLSTVLLAATAEIERYQRVRYLDVDQLYVVGHAVADLVHLLAELLENATSFSPPTTFVQVSARAHGPDQAVIEIADEGLGMTDSSLVEANTLLAEPPTADVAVSERMGLFVVGHLSARQGVRVRLRGAERGVVAMIWLPGTLLAAAPPQEETEFPTQSRRVLAALAPGTNGTNGAAPVPSAPAVGGNRAVELPVPGRRPGRTTLPRPARPVPVRAEDVLASASGSPAPSTSTWWSRQGGRRPNPAPTSASATAAVPPEVPVTGGINANGLPVRVPMAQLSAATGSATAAVPAPPAVPAQRQEPDPEAVGGMLSRYYGGLRRAEAEETTEITMPPAGVRSEREQ